MTGSVDKDDVARVWKLIDDIDVCMFTSHDGAKLRSRPMSSHARQSENAIYFLTDVEGHKDQEVAANSEVVLSYAKPGSGKFLAVTGRARVLDDRVLIKDLWDKDAEAFWEGADDPKVRVIEVVPDEAQFWEGPHGVVATVQMVIAAATAMPPVMGDQRKVDLR
ncbi:pyridoxamine 5'-phosphate oxidase family protein [Terricaulis sp.]|uniref:pyridoxamine 5'-phosphate oxidase family protein n=1 Tax=Terricaulis sp. TaxID=2768686 RepID=UPI0037852E89